MNRQYYTKLTESKVTNDGFFEGRGNTTEGHNPFTFSYDIETGKISVLFDGYSEVTANKATVKSSVIDHYKQQFKTT